MYRQLILAAAGCGLIACANGTEPTSKTPSPSAAPAKAPMAMPASGGLRVPADTVVAKWKGGQLTYGDLAKDNKAQLRQMRNKYLQDTFQFERQAIERTVVEKLVKAAASAKGQEEEAFLKGEVGDITVTDDEVKQFHESDPRIKSQPIAQLAPRIKDFLSRRKEQEKMVAVFDRLKKEAGMEVTLPKVELEKVSFELAGRPAKGKADAKITVVEFSDFECPYCSRATAGVEALVKAYPDDVKVVFMHFPLGMHPNAMPAAIASQCANVQGKFWAYHDVVFADQSKLAADNLETHAKTAGLDVDKFKACVKDPATKAFVEADMKQGAEAGVQGTPSFYINGEPFSGGVPTPEQLKPYLEG